MKQDFWETIKMAAVSGPCPALKSLDELLAKYHALQKTEIDSRYYTARAIVVQAGEIIAGTRRDGAYVAASILRVSAEDTISRLKFDLKAAVFTMAKGTPLKPLDKAHRHEVLDPLHHKWGVSANFKALRQEWQAELLKLANAQRDGELVVRSFYDFLAGYNMANMVRTKYYSEAELQKKRLLIAKPNSEFNKGDETIILRRKRGCGGEFRRYHSKDDYRMFVMDARGDFYAADSVLKQDGFWTHHSSLGRGEAILGAGLMKVENGRLTHLSQQSGHYRPTPAQMVNVLQKLDQLGVDLYQVILMAYTYFNDAARLKPDGQAQGKPFPQEQLVRASFYLETNGEWARNPDIYQQSPWYDQVTQLDKIILNWNGKALGTQSVKETVSRTTVAYAEVPEPRDQASLANSHSSLSTSSSLMRSSERISVGQINAYDPIPSGNAYDLMPSGNAYDLMPTGSAYDPMPGPNSFVPAKPSGQRQLQVGQHRVPHVNAPALPNNAYNPMRGPNNFVPVRPSGPRQLNVGQHRVPRASDPVPAKIPSLSARGYNMQIVVKDDADWE